MSRIRTSGAAIVLMAAIAVPATAQAGFFDQFFGGQPQPFFGFQRFGGPAGAPVGRRFHHARAVVDEKPVRQMPTDLMHDKTLRYGDAVMMETGISIFTGERKASHDRDDFSPLQGARVRPGQKIALGAVDVTRLDSVTAPKSSGGLVSGRSSTVTMPVAKGVMIQDPSGKSIRYVGP
jgi:hypothetical protein